MNNVLIYGDSNAWGYAKGGARLDWNQQWPNIFGKLMGSKYRLVQEGLPGRTAGPVDKNLQYLDGQAPFEVILRSALPVELIIIALGTNDLKPVYNQTASDIAKSLKWYKNISNELVPTAKIVFILPPNFVYKDGGMKDELRVEVINEMLKNPEKDQCLSLDNIELSDGVHFSLNGHNQVAQMVSDFVKNLD